MAIEKIAEVVGYGGASTAVVSGGAVLFGLTAAQWSVIGVIGGLVIGLSGFLVRSYFDWRRLQMDLKRAEMTQPSTPKETP